MLGRFFADLFPPPKTSQTNRTIHYYAYSAGKYLYINSSSASVTGDVAHLKTPLLPSGGSDGYCLTFWHHMFGATVGSLRVLLQTTDPRNKTMVQLKSNPQSSTNDSRVQTPLQSAASALIEKYLIVSAHTVVKC